MSCLEKYHKIEIYAVCVYIRDRERVGACFVAIIKYDMQSELLIIKEGNEIHV